MGIFRGLHLPHLSFEMLHGKRLEEKGNRFFSAHIEGMFTQVMLIELMSGKSNKLFTPNNVYLANRSIKTKTQYQRSLVNREGEKFLFVRAVTCN